MIAVVCGGGRGGGGLLILGGTFSIGVLVVVAAAKSGRVSEKSHHFVKLFPLGDVQRRLALLVIFGQNRKTKIRIKSIVMFRIHFSLKGGNASANLIADGRRAAGTQEDSGQLAATHGCSNVQCSVSILN